MLIVRKPYADYPVIICGCSLVVKYQLPKLRLGVRFPSSAPENKEDRKVLFLRSYSAGNRTLVHHVFGREFTTYLAARPIIHHVFDREVTTYLAVRPTIHHVFCHEYKLIRAAGPFSTDFLFFPSIRCSDLLILHRRWRHRPNPEGLFDAAHDSHKNNSTDNLCRPHD